MSLRRRGSAIYKPYQGSFEKKPVACSLGIVIIKLGLEMLGGRRENRDPDVMVEREVEAMGALFVH